MMRKVFCCAPFDPTSSAFFFCVVVPPPPLFLFCIFCFFVVYTNKFENATSNESVSDLLHSKAVCDNKKSVLIPQIAADVVISAAGAIPGDARQEA